MTMPLQTIDPAARAMLLGQSQPAQPAQPLRGQRPSLELSPMPQGVPPGLATNGATPAPQPLPPQRSQPHPQPPYAAPQPAAAASGPLPQAPAGPLFSGPLPQVRTPVSAPHPVSVPGMTPGAWPGPKHSGTTEVRTPRRRIIIAVAAGLVFGVVAVMLIQHLAGIP
jgi:hypothetical protein